MEDGCDEHGDDGADAELRGALAGDDAPAGGVDGVRERGVVELVRELRVAAKVLLDADAADGDVRARDERGVAVLAHAERLDLVAVDVHDARDVAPEADGVERRSGAEHPGAREVELAVEVLRHDVRGVGHADEEAGEAGLRDGLDYAAQDRERAGEHLEARLSGATAAAGRHHDEACVRAVVVGAHADVHVAPGGREHVLQVFHLRVRSGLVDVQEHDLVCVLADHEAHGHVASHVSSSDDYDLSC